MFFFFAFSTSPATFSEPAASNKEFPIYERLTGGQVANDVRPTETLSSVFLNVNAIPPQMIKESTYRSFASNERLSI